MNSRMLLTMAFLLLAGVLPLWGQKSTTYTYTPNPKGAGYFTRTGDAYLPGVTVTDLGLDEPQDLYIHNDMVYIADKGNRRIVLYSISEGAEAGQIVHEGFTAPTGVWITEEGILYVADPKAEKVFLFDEEGNELRDYGRPVSAVFGDRDFAPRKISVDEAGNMFIIGEGLYDGVIQLSPEGSFLGYFTSNKVGLSFVEKLQDLLFTDAQKANLLDRSPVTFSNLFVDTRNILYTSSMGDEESSVKKHNAAGAVIVSGPGSEDAAPMDLWVSRDEIIVSVFADGETVIYSREGEIIATFGYAYNRADIAGLFERPSAVAMDDFGVLWYLDEEKSFLQSYEPTPYVQNIYEALGLFEKGEYRASIEIWKEVLKVNQISRIAHLSIGKNYLFLREYEKALYHTEIANSRTYYSDSFWEIRNIWLQNNIIYIVLLVLLLFIAGPAYRWAGRKIPSIRKAEKPFRYISEIPLVNSILYQFHVMRHPNDSFYYLKKEQKGSMTGAVLILSGFFMIFLLYMGGKGFIYQKIHREDIDFLSVVIGFFGGIFLFLVSNYLGTSIHDGRGGLKDLFRMFSYSLAPLWIAMVLVIALSHILTLNEVFALQLIMMIGWAWWFVQLILGLRETHDYSTGGALMSILFSLIFMLVLLIVMVIIYVMGQQVYRFFLAIGKELFRNVF